VKQKGSIPALVDSGDNLVERLLLVRVERDRIEQARLDVGERIAAHLLREYLDHPALLERANDRRRDNGHIEQLAERHRVTRRREQIDYALLLLAQWFVRCPLSVVRCSLFSATDN
jgi:hypothetical protein